MDHVLRVRATSLGASALLVGGLLVAATTLTSTVMTFIPQPPPDVITVVAPPPPAVPPPAAPRTPRQPLTELTPAPTLAASAEEEQPLEEVVFAPIGSSGPVEITRPTWTQRPENLARYYPRRALTRGAEGVVELDCLVRASGALECEALSETPSGWGFADAALRMSRDYRMAPAMRNGVAVEGRYRMRVPFDVN